jgi:hypothetical protein
LQESNCSRGVADFGGTLVERHEDFVGMLRRDAIRWNILVMAIEESVPPAG